MDSWFSVLLVGVRAGEHGNWKALEYWKRVTCIMMIRSGLKNLDILAAIQCSLNTMNAVRCELENFYMDVEAVASRKGHSKCSDCVRTTKFVKKLQKKVLQDPGKAMWTLAKEMNGVATMKKALNKDLRYFLTTGD